MNFIVVVDERNGIGCEGKLLTHLPEDLKYFKEKTLEKVIVMGRGTLESLPGKKILPDRTTVVLTRDLSYQFEGAHIVHSLEELLVFCQQYEKEDVFVVGGADVYHQLIPYCQFGYVTKIHATLAADKYLDDLDQMPNWKKIWESDTRTHKELSFSFTKYENLSKS